VKAPCWLLAWLLLTACSHAPEPGSATVRVRTGTGVVEVRAAVADTDPERQSGLSGVRNLPANGGMAFVYERPVRPRFWMKDTLIPLSIAFWGPDGRIVGIRSMPPCHADPCPTYGSPAPIVGALEVNSGFFGEHGVEVGDRVDLRSS
jgi:uncharacterized membrane protein (UPF0127 family)